MKKNIHNTALIDTFKKWLLLMRTPLARAKIRVSMQLDKANEFGGISILLHAAAAEYSIANNLWCMLISFCTWMYQLSKKKVATDKAG
jgi:hypothetical protein